jgi:hypothetical protein
MNGRVQLRWLALMLRSGNYERHHWRGSCDFWFARLDLRNDGELRAQDGASVVAVAGSYGVENGITSRAVRASVVLFALYAAMGCSFSKDREEAEQLGEQYFSKMQGGDMDGALSLYSTRFYEVTSRADWLAFLQNQRARCGTPKTHSLVTWNVLNTFGTNAGTTTTLVYDVQYSSCRVSEKMTIFKPSGGRIQIQGHFLTPKAGTPGDKDAAQTMLST